METPLGKSAISLSTDYVPADEAWSVMFSDPSPLHWLFHPPEQAELRSVGLAFTARPWNAYGAESASEGGKPNTDCFALTPVSPEKRLLLLYRVTVGWYELGIWPIDYSCLVAAAQEGPMVLRERESVATISKDGELVTRRGVVGLICDALLVPPEFLSGPEFRQMLAVVNVGDGRAFRSVNVDAKGAVTVSA